MISVKECEWWTQPINIGAKWQKQPIHSIFFSLHDHTYELHRCVTIDNEHVVEWKDTPFYKEEYEDEFTIKSKDHSWAGIIAACGFASRSEARRKGFTGDAPFGWSEKRIAKDMTLLVWRPAPRIKIKESENDDQA